MDSWWTLPKRWNLQFGMFYIPLANMYVRIFKIINVFSEELLQLWVDWSSSVHIGRANGVSGNGVVPRTGRARFGRKTSAQHIGIGTVGQSVPRTKTGGGLVRPHRTNSKEVPTKTRNPDENIQDLPSNRNEFSSRQGYCERNIRLVQIPSRRTPFSGFSWFLLFGSLGCLKPVKAKPYNS